MEQRLYGPAAAAVEYLAGVGRPAGHARILVLGTGCGGSCLPHRPCTIRSLRSTGALVDFYDPVLPEALCGSLRARGLRRITPADLHRYDLVILQQSCSQEDCRRMAAACRCLLDARRPEKVCII